MSYQENSFNTIPPVTKNILIINAIIWLACLLFERFGINLVNILGLHFFHSPDFLVFQLITYMFTHVALGHIFFNMFAVFMFGATLERFWGGKRYLAYYMITGIGAGIIQLIVCYLRILSILNQVPDLTQATSLPMEAFELYHSVTIGASGAVFGVLLAFGMLFPNTSLYLLFIPVPIKAKYMVIAYGLIELYLGFANRVGDNVAHFAHLGGMLFGIIMILYWKRKDKKDGRYFY